MGHGHEARMAVWAIHIAPFADRFAQSLGDGARAKMPLLGVLADEQNEFEIGQQRKHWLAPQFGAFATWRQVAALGVKARETEAHGDDGDDLRIVENVLPE